MSAIYRLVVVALFILTPVQAFARDYVVEVIVFSNVGAAGDSNEEWNPNTDHALKFEGDLSEKMAQASIVLEPRSLASLANIHAALLQSFEHDILTTYSWVQAENDYEQSPLVKILGLNLQGTIRVYAPNLLFTELNLQHTNNPIENSFGDNSVISGNINNSTVNNGSFNNGNLDSSINNNGINNSRLTPPFRASKFFMNEKRRLKLNETHYFDHPKFGVILHVSPLSPKEEVE